MVLWSPVVVLLACLEGLQKWKVEQKSKVLVSEGVVQWSGVFVVEEVVCPLLAVKMMVGSAVNQAEVEVVEMMVVKVGMDGFLILVVMENGVGDFGWKT